MYKLIYKSRSKGAIDKHSLRDILYTSLDRNRKSGLTGVLFASQTHYLQFLEGSFENINKTFSRIASDPRHSDIELISLSSCDRRIFGKWFMKGFGIFDMNKEAEAQLIEKYGAEENGVRFPRDESTALSFIHDVQLMTRERS